MFTCSDTSSTYQASEGAWNGQAFECYFCDKEYDTLAILNQHLNSGVHEGKAFHCKHCGFTATRQFSSCLQLFFLFLTIDVFTVISLSNCACGCKQADM